MTLLHTLTFSEIGLKPDGDRWVCCSSSESDVLWDAHVDIDAEEDGEDEAGFMEYGWEIVNILVTRPAPKRPDGFVTGRQLYTALTGAAFADAKAWIESKYRADIETYISHGYQEAQSDAIGDRRAEEIKHMEAVS